MSVKNKEKRKGHYLTNKEFLEEILVCQKTGRISEKLGNMFILVTKKISTKHNFSGYSYLDEMVGAGHLACCSSVNKFNTEKSSNAFAYFSQIIWTAFLQILIKEKRHQEIRDQLLVDNEMTPSFSFSEKFSDFVIEEEEE